MRRFLSLLVTLLVFGSGALYAQTKQVSGKVLSAEDNKPIPGVSVYVKEASRVGAMTTIDGQFTLKNVPVNAKTLIFRFVGFKTQEVVIADGEIIVKLSSEATQIDEVMVVAYGTTKKSTFTGSAQAVKSDKLANGRSESLDKALDGKVSGVRVGSVSGNPGSSGEVLVRGVGSITASSQPLYVIDGIAVETGNFGMASFSSNVLASINPEDIESLTVLKDAAASSLYGSRAANGVIVITTKRGSEGETVFSLKSSYGWSTMAVDAFNMMSGPQWVEYQKQAQKSVYLNTNKALFPSQANYSNRATYEAGAVAYAESKIAGVVKNVNGNTEWKKELFRVAKTQDHQLSISGGTKKTKFYTGFGFTNYEGIIMNSSYDRMSGIINLDHQAKSWMKFGISQRLSYTEQKGFSDNAEQGGTIASGSPIGQLCALEPTASIYNADGTYNKDVSFSKAAHPSEVFGGKMVKLNSKGLRNLTNAYIQLTPIKGLSIKSSIGLDNLNQKTFRFWHPESIDGLSLKGLGEYTIMYNNVFTSSNIATYDITLKEKHNITALVGFEASKNSTNEIDVAANKYSTGNLTELENASEKRTAASALSENTMLSYLSRLEYNYDSKYYFSGSIRNDASSRLGVDERSANFYSLSASWRLNREPFLENMRWLTDLKVRGSYGTNGTLPPYNYKHMGLYAMSGNYNGENAIYIQQPENRNLTWEKSKSANIGLDISVFSRFSASVEFWKKYTSDLLLDVNCSYVTAFETSTANVGEVSNSGVDLEVHTVNIDTKDFKWKTDFTLGYLKTKIEKLPNGNDINQGFGSVNLFLYREGEPMYTMYLPKYYGVNPENGLAQFYINPENPSTVDNLTYYYDEAQRGISKKALPDFTGGLANSMSYKGFEFSFLVTYQFGGNMYDHFGYFTNHDGRRRNTFTIQDNVVGDYWTKPGDVVKFPRPYFGANGTNSDLWSTRQVYSTDHIRLKEVSLTYSLPRNLLSKYGITNVKVFAKSANTAMLWIKEKSIKFDPEIAVNGVRTTDVPALKSITVGLSLNF